MTSDLREPPAETLDAFLGGRVTLAQPREGYRAATDPVLLAAAVPAEAGQTVLELGVGTGAAALCLAARVPGLMLTGVELRTDHARLARENAARNDMRLEVIEADIAALPAGLRQQSFDHVMMNPPYHGAESLASPAVGRDAAHREHATGLATWIDAGMARLKPGGWLTLIQRAERLPDILGALEGRAGAIAVKPLAARTGRPAKRVILRARKSARSPFRLLAPLILHQGAAHIVDADTFTEAARAILRDGTALSFEDHAP